MAGLPRYPGAPKWVKISARAVTLFALLMVILLHAGGGTHRNIPPHDGTPDRPQTGTGG